MRAGDLDRVVSIETLAETISSRGEAIPGTPVVVATVHARKVSLSGTESRAADQRYAIGTYRWEMRYRPGITPKHRLNENGVYFDIIDVDETRKRSGELHLVTIQRGVDAQS